MTGPETPRKPDRFPADKEMAKSIFPTFDVNVPMPSDTAVPGSYNEPARQSSSGAADSGPAEAGE